jgi:hypothetical protein
MKLACTCLFLFACITLLAQSEASDQNLFLITTDGFRWQEIFNGADSLLMSDTRYVKDTSLIRQMYWDDDLQKRRTMLMPFFWNVIAKKGQLFGNRLFDNKVNVKNLYKVSYPGYNEILTGYTDPRIVINLPHDNQNFNVLESINARAAYQGQVAIFSSWNVFPYILNRDRNDLPSNCGYEKMLTADSVMQLLNRVQDHIAGKTHCRYDWLTFMNAEQYILNKHPRVIMIALGETDEFAHGHRYDLYLKQAALFDKMIGDLWYYVQTCPFYRNKTTFIITTDHGRGARSVNWSNHSLLTPGSAQTWLAVIGPGLAPLGEIKTAQQIYEKQLTATIVRLLGESFASPHRIGKPISFARLPDNTNPVKDDLTKR